MQLNFDPVVIWECLTDVLLCADSMAFGFLFYICIYWNDACVFICISCDFVCDSVCVCVCEGMCVRRSDVSLRMGVQNMQASYILRRRLYGVSIYATPSPLLLNKKRFNQTAHWIIEDDIISNTCNRSVQTPVAQWYFILWVKFYGIVAVCSVVDVGLPWTL